MQDVHAPNRDVCLQLTSAREAGGGSTHGHLPTGTGASFMPSGGGGGAGSSVMSQTAAVGLPQSLILVTLLLPDGAALGFYM